MTSRSNPKDYNLLGIEAPSTKKWVSWETIKGDLGSFLRQGAAPEARLAHVEGPHGSGKSTGMLEYVWDEIRSSSPDTMVIYVPSFKYEAMLLGGYFESSSSPYEKLKGKTYVAIKGDVEPKLHLATIAGLRDAMREDVLHGTLPEKIALLMDLEPAPTADGELLLSELAVWYHMRSEDETRRLSEFTLITMATFSRPPVHEFMRGHLGTRCEHIVMTVGDESSQCLSTGDFPLKTEWKPRGEAADTPAWIGDVLHDALGGMQPGSEESIELLNNLVDESLDKLSEREDAEEMARELTAILDRTARVDVGHDKGGLCRTVVVIQSDGEGIDVADAIEDLAEKDVEIADFYISDTSTFADLVLAMVHYGPKVVRINAKVPVVLHIPNVTAVVSYDGYDKPRPLVVKFDSYLRQFESSPMPKSRMDLLKEQSYAMKTSHLGTVDILFYSCDRPENDHGSSANLDSWALAPYAPAYDAELLSLAFELCAMWPDDTGQARMRLLTPLLSASNYRLLGEMWRRLVNIGCLRYLPESGRRPVLNGPKANLMMRLLGPPELDTRDIPLVFFAAGIRYAASAPVKRVMVRITTLKLLGDRCLPSRITGLLREDFPPQNDVSAYADRVKHFREVIASESLGVGAQESEHGEIWMKLGLLLKTEEESLKDGSKQGGNENGGGDASEVSSEVSSDTQGARPVTELISTLERFFGLGPSEDPVRDTELGPDEVRAVNVALLNSWMYRLVLFRRHIGEPAVEVTSRRQVKVSKFPWLDAHGRLESDPNPVNRSVYAFYSCMAEKDGTHTIQNLTEIPKDLVLDLMEEKGVDVLGTRYPDVLS
ncbi:hypothetical protein F4819DRAFT_506898 [Hypoxylon fuscum]|nr:hypothetical protein F4819DRAFT_506898 [Hypoxylon fuscum]